MRCMSCLDYFQRKQVCLCHGCKAWYCPGCLADHTPCNENEVNSQEAADDIDDVEDEVDDSKPGIWIMKMPEATRVPFNIWNYMADPVAVKMMMPEAGIS